MNSDNEKVRRRRRKNVQDEKGEKKLEVRQPSHELLLHFQHQCHHHHHRVPFLFSFFTTSSTSGVNPRTCTSVTPVKAKPFECDMNLVKFNGTLTERNIEKCYSKCFLYKIEIPDHFFFDTKWTVDSYNTI